MDVIYEQLDRSALFWADILALLPPLLHQLMVKLNEEQRLVLHRGEEVVLANEVEDVWPPQAQEEGERFARLAIHGVPTADTSATGDV